MRGLADPTLPPGEREARSIEDLQTRLARIGRQIAFALDSTASRAEHSLTHERPRFSFFQMLSPRGGGRREAPKFEQVAPGVAKHEQEIVLAPGVEPEPDRYLPLRVAAAAAEFELPISPVTLQNLRRCPIRDSVWMMSRANCSCVCWPPAGAHARVGGTGFRGYTRSMDA